MHALRTILGLSLALVAGRVIAADNPEFKPFASKEGRFTISFPGKPEVSSSTIKAPIGDMELHVFRATRGGKESYTLTYNDYPPDSLKGADSDKILDAARDGGVGTTHGKVTKETKIAKSDKNLPSRELEIDIQGITAYARLLLAGNRLYVIMAYPDGSGGSASRAKQFLDSFKLTKE
ncbi:MAG TPA: hypothetical protein VKB78_12390 [Pirellulales bacterium]|nr:hypothetical protein [Pirellulales bacterium]